MATEIASRWKRDNPADDVQSQERQVIETQELKRSRKRAPSIPANGLANSNNTSALPLSSSSDSITAASPALQNSIGQIDISNLVVQSPGTELGNSQLESEAESESKQEDKGQTIPTVQLQEVFHCYY